MAEIRIPCAEDLSWGGTGLTFRREMGDHERGYCLAHHRHYGVHFARPGEIVPGDGFVAVSGAVVVDSDADGRPLMDGHAFSRAERYALAERLLACVLPEFLAQADDVAETDAPTTPRGP